jgi:carbonic anhydrase/acetyltransferase-like protein (isoleucine patch superfamily)
MSEGTPKVDETLFLADGAHVTGNVTIGKNVGIWYNAVVRGDEATIEIGDNSNVQDNAVVHVGYGYDCKIGNGVTIGHGAIVHGCTVGDNTIIGMGAIILNGAKVGKNCIIGAGALVAEGKEIPDNSVAFGSPAKVFREMRPEDIEHNKQNAMEYVQLIDDYKKGVFHEYKK